MEMSLLTTCEICGVLINVNGPCYCSDCQEIVDDCAAMDEEWEEVGAYGDYDAEQNAPDGDDR
jgi:hypothetical protein